MPMSLNGLYYIRFIDHEDGITSMCLGQFVNFVSPNFILVQPYYESDGNYLPTESLTILGIPHFERCLIYQTLEEVIEEFELAIEEDEDDCE